MAVAFTEREQKIMAMAWQCFEEQPKVDFTKLAGLVGMTNEGSARNAWAAIRKKLAQQAADAGDGNASKSIVNVTPRKKRGPNNKAGEEEGSPSKKSKGNQGQKSKDDTGDRQASVDSAVAVKTEQDFESDH
ncbi:uncharacterized protein K489DRAFT_366340 [Dissoconium aciculare CBS 342.82]|uniref:Myb-like domain-containing protein n=1 Tax=Dissoconium aciculare CBS 342.82 TaxID=1314786 RepID=A0A6J3MJN7_9PEZI|nr:uncharacterized protein K489DRAFT_366340 [Dissoconium aciculare CBS 342.82]KAF1827152.1 hypothetical protein K489DRAFT_366340 [Dissoconium aciculare CBS 342.82]